MKQAFQKLSIWAVAALFAPVSLFAQKEDKDKEKDKEAKDKKHTETYVITRNGDNDSKVTIEIVGDKIMVNGKQVDEDSDEGDVRVRRVRNGAGISSLSKLGSGAWNYDKDNNWKFDSDAFNHNFSYLAEDANRAMLGVTTEKHDKGVEVQSITKESGAEKAGLKEGDIITNIDGKEISDPDVLSKAVRAHKPGDKVSITFLRDNKEQKVTAELTKWKGVNSWGSLDKNFKLDMKDFTPNIQVTPSYPRTPNSRLFTYNGGAPKMGLSIQDTDDGKGVKVIEVDEDSNAAKAGLKEDDVITEIDGKAVNSADEISKIIKESKDKGSVMMKLQRAGKTQNVEVKIPKKLKIADL